VSDTLAQSYVHETSQTPGAAAEAAADRKRNEYSSLSQSYLFVPIAAETMGAISKDGMDFSANLEGASHNVQVTTGRAPYSFSDYPF